MRQLHLANIANVAYGYGKILRSTGVEADVLCYDLSHILSLPEWVEGDFDIQVGDEWHPDLNRREIAAIDIPQWYRRIRTADVASPSGTDTSAFWNRNWVEQIVRFSQRFGPRWTVRHEDVAAYQLLCEKLQAHHFGRYDLIFGYAYGAVPPLLSSTLPYVPVEIGTLRDTVNVDSPLGRLLALAYRTAPHTIITNADCESAARSLGLQSYSYVPHPVDEDVFRPLPAPDKAEIRKSFCGPNASLLIAPARQSWDIKANDRYLRAFAEFVRGGSDAKLLIAEWGPDVARARSLIRELRIDGFVSWFSPAPERRLARMFAAADLVLDQFGAFGTFGLIAPKAMACGTPCLLSFDAGLHAWCFDEPPPLVAAATVGEILDSLRRYLGDDVRRERCGRQSREWIVKHHSKRIVADKINRIAQIVHSSARQRIGFDELRAKRLASIAMAKRVRGISSRVTGAKRLIGKPWRVGKRILSELRHLEDNRDRLARLERRLQEQVAQRDAAFVNVFDVMGQNRLADHNVLTAIRNELLETLVRARLALPFHREEAPVAPRARPALSLADARGKLAAMAPLNWETYVECLDRGTASYQSFPPGSCSTASHAQADLFRGFLRPYLRGQVLDVGCGPQPVPWYLHGYPLDFVRGIDPISRPLDHPFHFVSGFGEFLPWDDEQFDLVISGTSLDHYYLLDVGLREALRVLRPGGHFVAWIAEFTGAPAYDPYTTRLDAAYDSEHLYHIDRAWFLPLITGTGFVAAEVLHFKLPFSYLFMSFQKPFPVPASRNT